jgi:hypothetical protein
MPQGEEVIGEIRKNANEVIRVTRGPYKGHLIIRLWVWYREGNEWRPGKQGLAFRAEMLPEVMGLLNRSNEAKIIPFKAS